MVVYSILKGSEMVSFRIALREVVGSYHHWIIEKNYYDKYWGNISGIKYCVNYCETITDSSSCRKNMFCHSFIE